MRKNRNIFDITRLRYIAIPIVLFLCLSVFGQSNLTYELKVGTTGENTVLTEFPESYQGEKVNVRIETASLTDRFADRYFERTKFASSSGCDSKWLPMTTMSAPEE